MVANLIGSVTAGFAAVLLGTALARGLAEPAIDRVGSGFRSIVATATERSHPARTTVDRSNSAKVDAVGGAGGHRGTNEGSR